MKTFEMKKREAREKIWKNKENSICFKKTQHSIMGEQSNSFFTTTSFSI